MSKDMSAQERLDALDIYDEHAGLRAISPAMVLALVERLEAERDTWERRCETAWAWLNAALQINTAMESEHDAALTRETERADMAWKNTREIDKARMEQLAEIGALQIEVERLKGELAEKNAEIEGHLETQRSVVNQLAARLRDAERIMDFIR